jgi:signal transduction histidine kinase
MFKSVLDHAVEFGQSLSLTDCVRLSECLSIGAAESVREYSAHRDAELKREQFKRFAFMAHELRNPLTSAMAAWWGIMHAEKPDDTLNQGLTRSLDLLASRIDVSLHELRALCKGVAERAHIEHVAVAELAEAASMDAQVHAYSRGVNVVTDIPHSLYVMCDRRFLLAALTNVVRNAVKFSRPQGTVAVRARAEGKRVMINVDDECGGLLPGQAEQVFEAFEQVGPDRSGFGLGLAIARQAVEACAGTISVRNRSPVGCTFVIDLPRAPTS